ncbi:MAG: PilZ domain-containing protein [Thermodesulfobacteriota bacterium]
MGSDCLNRRESFRIDTIVPTSLRKFPPGVTPEAKIVPVALTDSTSWASELMASAEEINTSFALLLIEINTKLDLLLGGTAAPDSRTGKRLPRVSLSQLLYQASAKTDQLLDRHRIERPEDAIRVNEVSLSASGIKLNTMSNVSVGDTVEVRMLLNPSGQPVWVMVGGSVVRVTVSPEGDRQVAVNFLPMADPVRDAITTYSLKKQKELLRAERFQEL